MAENRSKVELLNAALLELGEVSLQLTDDGEPDDDVAEGAFALYPGARDICLYGYPWSWSLTRKELTEVPGYTPGRYMYQFNLPELDIGRLRSIHDTDTPGTPPRVDNWAREGNALYTNFKPVFAEYQRDVGEGAYPALFRAAFILYLAHRLSLLVVEDRQIGTYYKNLSDEAFMDAKRTDSQSNTVHVVEDFSFITARTGGVDSPFGRRS